MKLAISAGSLQSPSQVCERLLCAKVLILAYEYVVAFYTAWQYYDISKVQWWVFPKQIIPWVGMFFVVAFSSSLDIAAIEMELGVPMDYDR